ncbi:MAG: formylglycine-generating enzyme family protein [Rhodomicrobiaceae bacterium]
MSRHYTVLVAATNTMTVIKCYLFIISSGFILFSFNKPVLADGLKGKVFKDCHHCPSMIVLPAGNFMMGSLAKEPGHQAKEAPRHKVKISKPFAVGRFEVTFEEWQACLDAGGCKGYMPNDQGWGRSKRPVINVNWHHVQSYLRWLNKKTGKPYRLLTEAEWEYAARAGSNTIYWWGNRISRDYTNFGKVDCCGGAVEGKDHWKYTAPVGQFEANSFGLYDMLGNVSEWIADCVHKTYKGAPNDGRAWLNENGGNCLHHILRGGNWSASAAFTRIARRGSTYLNIKNRNYGFRVALDLE